VSFSLVGFRVVERLMFKLVEAVANVEESGRDHERWGDALRKRVHHAVHDGLVDALGVLLDGLLVRAFVKAAFRAGAYGLGEQMWVDHEVTSIGILAWRRLRMYSVNMPWQRSQSWR